MISYDFTDSGIYMLLIILLETYTESGYKILMGFFQLIHSLQGQDTITRDQITKVTNYVLLKYLTKLTSTIIKPVTQNIKEKY